MIIAHSWTGPNSYASIIALVGAVWYLISVWMLRRHYIKNHAKTLEEKTMGALVVFKSIFYNKVKRDKKFSILLWNVRISLVVFLVGIILTFL